MSKLDKIKAFVFDVDGVFTNGGIMCDLKGELYRTFDSKDGFAMRMASMNGYKLGIITGGRSGSIRARFKTCGVADEDVYLGSRHKIADLEDFCRRHKLDFEEVMYMGDDLPDLEIMQKIGLSACPKDAVAEIISISDVVSKYEGGHGSVREVIEMIMKKQNKWNFDSIVYKKSF